MFQVAAYGRPMTSIDNRVTAMTGTRYPIVQAPMGWIARAPLASAVSNAGGLGVIELNAEAVDIPDSKNRAARLAAAGFSVPAPPVWVDEVTDGDRQADILANAPDAREGFFTVPKGVE